MVRVQALGARVEYFRYADGTLGQLPRLFADQAEGPGLPLSRGIGFCDPLAAKAGVVPEPEVSMRRLTRADRFVVLGSDGLWASLSAAEAVAVVEQVAGEAKQGEPGTGTWLAADWDLAELLLPEPVRLARQLRLRRLAAAAAEALCAASLENDRMRRDRQGRRDDVTAIVLWLDHPPKAP
ncbi:hypothetical protein FNF28_06093 [Cafeteria roenbergensis]|uniref:PPM-type phosphatase domain-containing protein n=1 Tax=Cafeteria roenbergensis TaxID=33653 RepID=A0A5A8D3C4_CAFRO|nr:hypothetical protein FNF28_06093 [Cafeteria roenbergensis]